MDYRPSGSSLCGIFQARISEWISRGSSWPRDQTLSPALEGRLFTTEPPENTHTIEYKALNLDKKKTLNHCIEILHV